MSLVKLNIARGVTGTLPTSNYVDVGGKILQVKQATTTTQVEASFSSETSLGLAVSITPSSSSNKILVFVQSAGCGTRDTSTYWKMTLRKDTTDILNFPAYVGINQSSEETYPSGVYLDSPSSTSSISYNCTGTRVSGSANCYFNHTASSPNQATSTITVMEVSA